MKPGKLQKEPREAVKRLAAEGWIHLGRLRSGHLLMEHRETGVRISIAQSPSDGRSRKNELTRARKRVAEARART